MADVRFGVLGPLAVWSAAGTPVRIPETKVRALLAHLLAAAGRPVPVDALIDHLWGDAPPADPPAALRTRVSQLRGAIGRELVVHGGAGYLLRVDPDSLDATRFETLVRRSRGLGDPRARTDLLTEALALWRGPAFADVADEPFARPVIARLEEQRLAAVEERAEARLAIGEHHGLAPELADLVTLHPLRERLRGVHMLALYREGRQADALAAYEDLRSRLADELGANPGPELAAVHQAILRQDPALEPEPAARVPVPFTELIGREHAVDEVRALLDAARLVTLVGPGGVGKTRLAFETAARRPGDVHVVELAGLPPGDGPGCTVAEAISASLGVRDDAALADALRTRRMLLVLDNCEHVTAAVARVVDDLLRAAPGLRVLATGREPLGLAGEHLYPVPPLDPADAQRLFAARAAAAAPGFTVDAGNAEAVAAICRRLDGLPLALELAATRVRALGVHELARRLDQRFQLLTGRGGPSRQQSLRAVIDWSWELLAPAERVVLRRLAVHVDGCTLGAAEAVCAGPDVGSEQVAGVLVRLVDRSLVSVVDGRDGPRYRLLESIAAYCTERLVQARELDEVREQHRRHYVALAERAASQLHGPEQRTWLRVLDAETGNLRAALDGPAADALRLVNALAWYWVLRGRLGEARRSLAAALATAGPAADRPRAVAQTWLAGVGLRLGEEGPAADAPAGPDPDLARALWFLGHARTAVGDAEENADLVARAYTSFRETGDRWGVAAALCTRARQSLHRADLPAVRADGERSRTLFRELGEGWGQVQAGFVLGLLAQITGDHHRAARLHRDGVRIAEELGLWTDVSDNLCQLGRVALLTGDHAEADRLHEQARQLAVEQGYTVGEELAELGIALAARRRGELDRAETILRRWLRWDRALDSDDGAALILAELGFVAELRGDAHTARELHGEGLAAARNTGDLRAVALALEGLAGAHALAGEHERAAELLAEAAAIRDAAGAPLPPAERGDVERIAAAVGGATSRS